MTTQRGAKTREQLLAAATTVFAERGFARATTKEIAKLAGVAEGTIYRHFADKQELFCAAFGAKQAMTAEEFLRLPELAGKDTVRENLRRFISLIEDVERTVAPLQASLWSDGALRAALGTAADPLLPLTVYLEAERALGRVRADVDCGRAAFALFAIPFASVVMSRMVQGQGPAGALDIMGALDIVLEGLLPHS